MSLPNNVLSTIPVPAPFIPPRNVVRFTRQSGSSDQHFGGIAISDPSHGINYQVWTAYTDQVNIWLTAPNTPPFIFLANVNPVWVALAFDQNSRPAIGYVQKNGAAFFYWFNPIPNAFVTTQLPTSALYSRIFMAMDDLRPFNIANSDVIIAYTRGTTLFMRVQRDRYGVEYTLGTVPTGTLVQIGMDMKWRFQFAFQNVQGNKTLPPVEWNPALGFNEPA